MKMYHRCFSKILRKLCNHVHYNSYYIKRSLSVTNFSRSICMQLQHHRQRVIYSGIFFWLQSCLIINFIQNFQHLKSICFKSLLHYGGIIMNITTFISLRPDKCNVIRYFSKNVYLIKTYIIIIVLITTKRQITCSGLKESCHKQYNDR